MMVGVSVFGAPAYSDRERAAIVQVLKAQRDGQADLVATLTGRLQVAEEDLQAAQRALDKCDNNRR